MNSSLMVSTIVMHQTKRQKNYSEMSVTKSWIILWTDLKDDMSSKQCMQFTNNF